MMAAGAFHHAHADIVPVRGYRLAGREFVLHRESGATARARSQGLLRVHVPP